jgi:hypothetical protein
MRTDHDLTKRSKTVDDRELCTAVRQGGESEASWPRCSAARLNDAEQLAACFSSDRFDAATSFSQANDHPTIDCASRP